MTYEEAISILTKDRALCLFNPLTGDVGPLNEDCRMSAEAMNLAIEALEKQIPKKPTRTNGGLSIAKKDFYTKCQLCNHNIPGVVRDARMRFCPFCGQKIDWSDDE